MSVFLAPSSISSNGVADVNGVVHSVANQSISGALADPHLLDHAFCDLDNLRCGALNPLRGAEDDQNDDVFQKAEDEHEPALRNECVDEEVEALGRGLTLVVPIGG